MKTYSSDKMDKKQSVGEPAIEYASRDELEDVRLRNAVFMSDMEKFRMFCKMMRIGKMLASAKVTHKPAE